MDHGRRGRYRSESLAPVRGYESQDFAGLAALLWDERDLLGDVLYQLVVAQLTITSGQVRWLARSEDGLRVAVQRLADTEVLRAVEVDALLRVHGLPADTTLRELSERAPAPSDGILVEHHDALCELLAEIEALTTTNARLLRVGSQDAEQTLERVGIVLTPDLAAIGASYRAALDTTARVRQMSLIDFLA